MARWRIPILVSVLLLLLAGVSASVVWGQGRQVSRTTQPTSMYDAYHLAKPKADEWEPNAKLYWINSVDSATRGMSSQGSDGRRSRWNVEFVMPGTDRHLNVLVVDGAVLHVQEFMNPIDWPPFEEFPTLDMGQVVSQAKSAGLKLGSGMALGYHFRLHYLEGQPAITIRGETDDGTPREIHFNLLTGQEIALP